VVQGNMQILDYVSNRLNSGAGFTVHEHEGTYLLNTWGGMTDKETKHSTRLEAQTLGMQWLLFCMTKGG
jgi:hypothetical protein